MSVIYKGRCPILIVQNFVVVTRPKRDVIILCFKEENEDITQRQNQTRREKESGEDQS